jgi:hypothetical protein
MTNDKSPMTKGKPTAPFVIGDLGFVIPWSLVGHWTFVINKPVIPNQSPPVTSH